MINLFEMLQAIYGKNIMSRTIGTRTNVIKFPSNKNNPTTTSFDVVRASENPAVIEKLKKIIEEEAPYIAKMNDSEKAIYEGNVRRLHDHLVSTGEIKPQVSAEVIGLGDKQPVTGKGLEDLIQTQGTVNPPTTLAGQVEQQGKKLEGLGKNLEQEFSKSKKRSAGEILDEYFHSYREMKSIEDEGLVRAVARQIMYQDLNAGRLKVPKEVEETIRGMTSKDVLDEFSQWYGSAALEDLFDNAQKFYRMESPQDAIKFLKKNETSNWEKVFQPREKPIKEYMEPEEFKKMMENATINKHGIVVPKGSEKLDNETAKEIYDFYLKSGDRKLINEEMNAISEGKKFDAYGVEDRNKILDILTDVIKKLGPPTVVGGIGIEALGEKSTPPQTENGTQQPKGLDYLTGGEGNYSMATGGVIRNKYGLGSIASNLTGVITAVNGQPVSQIPIPIGLVDYTGTPWEKAFKQVASPVSDTPAVTSSSSNLDSNTSLKDQYLNRLAALQSSSPSSSSYQDFKNLLQSKLEGKAEGGRIGYQTGGPTNKLLKYMIDMLVKEKDFNRGLLERSKPELVEGLFKQTYGKSAEEIANTVNQQLKGKSSMEVMNPKTGEITSPKKPVMTVEDLKNKHEDAFNAHDQIRVDIEDKIAPDMIAESMAEMKGKNYDNLSQKEQLGFYKKALAYVDDVRMTKRQNKMSVSNEMKQAMQEGVQKTNKMIELGLDPSNSKDYDKFLEMQSIQPQYTEVGGKKVLDATHPDTVQSFSEFAKASDPEGYAQFSKKVDRINELSTMRRNQNRFEQYGLEDYEKLGSERISELLKDIKKPGSFLEEERNISTNGAGKGLKNHEDVQFKVDKKTLQNHLEDLLKQKQVEEAQVELGQLKETNRKPNADGGLNYLMGF